MLNEPGLENAPDFKLKFKFRILCLWVFNLRIVVVRFR